MRQNTTKKLKVPAAPQIAHGKRMAQRMERATYTSNAELAAYGLKITKSIPLRKLAAFLRSKTQGCADGAPGAGTAPCAAQRSLVRLVL